MGSHVLSYDNLTWGTPEGIRLVCSLQSNNRRKIYSLQSNLTFRFRPDFQCTASKGSLYYKVPKNFIRNFMNKKHVKERTRNWRCDLNEIVSAEDFYRKW